MLLSCLSYPLPITTATMTKIFATGVTGYIGGDAVYAIATAHPEYEFTCLVRNSDKAASVARDYASFKFVYGDLDSTSLIEEEAKKADIVLSTSAIWSSLTFCTPNADGILRLRKRRPRELHQCHHPRSRSS